MNTEPRQKTISIPSTLDKRFREYCTRHNLGRIDAVARLLDVAESRDTTQDLLQEILGKLENSAKEPCVPAHTPIPIFSCGKLVFDIDGDGRRWFAKGKYAGKSVIDVIEEDPSYISWLLVKTEKYEPDARFFLTKEEKETFSRHQN